MGATLFATVEAKSGEQSSLTYIENHTVILTQLSLNSTGLPYVIKNPAFLKIQQNTAYPLIITPMKVIQLILKIYFHSC